MDMTTYLKNALADHVLRNTALTSPTTVYLALYTDATTDGGGGTEVVGGSYARQAITCGAPTAGLAENSAPVVFTDMPAVTVTNGAVLDAASGGNMLLHGTLVASLIVSAGSDVTFATGNLDVQFD